MTYFLPYQERWIRDGSRIKLMEKSRQVGITLSTAYSAVRRSIMGDGKDMWVSSRDERQAKLFLRDCFGFADVMGGVLRYGVVRKLSGHSLAFVNGGEIHSMSSNPDAQAGKRGSRILDEFALHPDPEGLYNVAYPGITWGGQLEILSTHRGANNFFNRLILEAKEGGNPKGISLHRVTLEDALKDGFLLKLKEKLSDGDDRLDMDEGDYYNYLKNSCASEESFLQEYMCVPADESSVFLPYELIDGALYGEDEEWSTEIQGEGYLGVDLGRERDLTVFWLLDKLGDVAYTRRVEVLVGASFDEQEAMLDEILGNGLVRCACIDKTGIGCQFSERAVNRYGSHRVEGVTFTQGVKEKMAYALRTGIERRRVRVPNDKKIIADLRSVRREIGVSGKVKFDAERTKDGHADRFWALALALKSSQIQMNIGTSYAQILKRTRL